MYRLLVFLGALCVAASAYGQEPPDVSLTSDVVNNRMTAVEKRVRAAAVKVVDNHEGGHGSGTVVAYKDMQLVITAQHVTPKPIGTMYEVERGFEKHLGIVIYSNPFQDLAVLYLPKKFKSVEPMKFKPRLQLPEVGEELAYSGFPSDHQIISVRGRVAGYERPPLMGMQIMLHTYGWFGSSGSGVFDSKGNLVGIIWGIDVERKYEATHVIEDIMWVTPIKNLNMPDAILALCSTVEFPSQLRVCR
jgi:S1-C subfamily serine protease